MIVVVSYRNSTSNHNHIDTVRVDYMLYLIEILHQTTTTFSTTLFALRCILSKFYIKPQLEWRLFWCVVCCILSKFYIKPQLQQKQMKLQQVVSYRNSTSNHNASIGFLLSLTVVSYRNSTSNHNRRARTPTSRTLYLIEILHQTTTSGLILIDKVLLTGCLPL